MSEIRLLLTLVDNGATPSGTTGNNVAHFLTLLIIFVLVLAVTFYTTRFIAKTQQGRTQSTNMEILETMPVANGKYLQIVRIGKKYVVLAIGKDTITTVTELSEEEYIPGERTQIGGFGDLLKKMSKSNAADGLQTTETNKSEGNEDKEV